MQRAERRKTARAEKAEQAKTAPPADNKEVRFSEEGKSSNNKVRQCLPVNTQPVWSRKTRKRRAKARDRKRVKVQLSSDLWSISHWLADNGASADNAVVAKLLCTFISLISSSSRWCAAMGSYKEPQVRKVMSELLRDLPEDDVTD